MLGCGRFCFVSALGIVVAVVAGAILYPLWQWDADIPLETRVSALIQDHVQPRVKFNLCTLLGLLPGWSDATASRFLIGFLGYFAVFDMVVFEDLTVAGVPVRLYRPAHIERDEKIPALVFYHGGGFVTGSIESHNAICMRFCSESSMAVISVDYRMAPEHVYPAAFEDAFAVTKAVVSDPGVAKLLAINSSLVSIGGDSVGGNLAAGISVYMGRTTLPALRSQVSVYPSVTPLFGDSTAYSEYAAPSGLDINQMFYYRSTYILGGNGPRDLAPKMATQSPDLLPPSVWRDATQRASGKDIDLIVPSLAEYPLADKLLNDSFVPLLAKDLSKTPPTILILAMVDPLLVDGQLYARRLKTDGVVVEKHEYRGRIHSFFGNPPIDLQLGSIRIRDPGNVDAMDAIRRAAKFVLAHNQ